MSSKIDNLIEYKQIKSIYNIIESSFESLNSNFLTSISKAFQNLVSKIDNEIEFISKYSNRSNESALFYTRQELVSSFINQSMTTPIIREFNQLISKDINIAYAINCYAVAKRMLWYDYETNEEFKPYVLGTANDSPEVKALRYNRKKAEDFYKAGNYDNAFLSFINTTEKYFEDFLSYYQLGLICFFEKCDFESALNYFKKAAKYAQSKIKKIYVLSTLFCSLIQRLLGISNNDPTYINEAISLAKTAYESLPDNPCTIYCYAQTLSSSPSYTSFLQQITSLLLDVIKYSKIFLLQMIYDRAFDNLLEEIDILYSGIYNEEQKEIKNIIEKIEDYIQRITNDSNYTVIPSKIAAIKNEANQILNEINNSQTYFQLLDLHQKAKILDENLQSIIKEISENKQFFNFKSFLEDLVLNYNNETNNILKPFIVAQKNMEDNIKELILLNKIYSNNETEEFLKSLNRKSANDNVVLPDDWRNTRIYSLVKTVTGCFVFMVIFTILFILSLLNLNKEINNLFVIIMVLNFLLIPLYGMICGRLYYGFIEHKRMKLIKNINRYESYLLANEEKKSSLLKEIKQRYIKLIIEFKKVNFSTAEQILDLALEGKYDKIKTLIS